MATGQHGHFRSGRQVQQGDTTGYLVRRQQTRG
ncbi:hypothetical protein P405_21995 [Streptomyces sp. FR-008]|nr:hypothetical protein P405_21995 [Streptomyces sp. FR-008]